MTEDPELHGTDQVVRTPANDRNSSSELFDDSARSAVASDPETEPSVDDSVDPETTPRVEDLPGSSGVRAKDVVPISEYNKLKTKLAKKSVSYKNLRTKHQKLELNHA